MKLLIAVDMEGISGVFNWDQVDQKHAEYQRFRHIMTSDVNAAIDGAARAGATEIVVVDGHAYCNNILIEELDARAHYNCGTPSPLSMVQGIDSGVDAAIFIGYHARVGTQNGILCHTWSSSRISNVWLNGRLVGETGINAAVCGHFDVPVLMVSGDQAVCAEAEEWIPGIKKAAVKYAVSRMAAECLPVAKSQELIHQTSELAVREFKEGKAPQPLKPSMPIKITIEFFQTEMADYASLLPGSNRLDAKRLELQAGDMVSAYRAFLAAVRLSFN